MLTSCIPPISKMVRIVDENPWTSEALIPKIGISETLKIKTSRRTTNYKLDIKVPM